MTEVSKTEHSKLLADLLCTIDKGSASSFNSRESSRLSELIQGDEDALEEILNGEHSTPTNIVDSQGLFISSSLCLTIQGRSPIHYVASLDEDKFSEDIATMLMDHPHTKLNLLDNDGTPSVVVACPHPAFRLCLHRSLFFPYGQDLRRYFLLLEKGQQA